MNYIHTFRKCWLDVISKINPEAVASGTDYTCHKKSKLVVQSVNVVSLEVVEYLLAYIYRFRLGPIQTVQKFSAIANNALLAAA